LLLGCGLRRRELTELTIDHFQRREDHWAIVDLIGKGGHVRTIPVPSWVKGTVDDWLAASRIVNGRKSPSVNGPSKGHKLLSMKEILVGAVGIEPTTFGLKGRCSTTELRP
jgi:integrase